MVSNLKARGVEECCQQEAVWLTFVISLLILLWQTGRGSLCLPTSFIPSILTAYSHAWRSVCRTRLHVHCLAFTYIRNIRKQCTSFSRNSKKNSIFPQNYIPLVRFHQYKIQRIQMLLICTVGSYISTFLKLSTETAKHQSYIILV